MKLAKSGNIWGCWWEKQPIYVLYLLNRLWAHCTGLVVLCKECLTTGDPGWISVTFKEKVMAQLLLRYVLICTGDNFRTSLRVTRGARKYSNLQVVIMHASHVCSQYSFGLPLRIMNGMHSTWFDHSHLDLLSLVIWSHVFWPSITWYLCKAQCWSKSVFTFNCCRLHSITFGYY